jgi:hypothetical protein
MSLPRAARRIDTLRRRRSNREVEGSMRGIFEQWVSVTGLFFGHTAQWRINGLSITLK